MTTLNNDINLRKGMVLIDDDPIALEIASRKLLDKYPEVQVKTFCSAIDAVTAIENKDISLELGLILLDLNMPLKSGWDFLVFLENEGIQAPVIILSSSINKNDQIKSAAFDNVLGFIIKPITIKKLEELIR